MQNKNNGKAALMRLIDISIRTSNRLEAQFMTVTEVKQKLDVTKRQILYWDFKGLKHSTKKTAKRTLRKFSIIDLWWFAVLRDLLKFGLKLEQCRSAFEALNNNVINSLFFTYHLAENDPIFLLVDSEGMASIHIGDCIGSEHLNRSYVIMPLNALFWQILTNTQREDFSVEEHQDERTGKKRLAFYFDDERREYKLSESERTFIAEREPWYFAEVGVKCTISNHQKPSKG